MRLQYSGVKMALWLPRSKRSKTKRKGQSFW